MKTKPFSFTGKITSSFLNLEAEATNRIPLVQTLLQSVPVGFRAGWGGRRREGDGGGGLRRVVHRQNEARAADCHVVLGQDELVSQAVVKRASPGAGRGALGVDGAGAGLVGADGDVGVHGAHAGIVQNEVGVVVKLLFVLVSGEGKEKRVWKLKHGGHIRRTHD